MDTAVKPIQYGMVRGDSGAPNRGFRCRRSQRCYGTRSAFRSRRERASSRPTLSLMLIRTPSRRSKEEPRRLLQGVDPNDVDGGTQRARLLCCLAMMRSPKKIILCACGIDGRSADPSVNGNG